MPTRAEKGRAGVACVSARFTHGHGETCDNFCRPHRACVRWRGGARALSPSSCQLAPSALPYEHGGFNPHPTYGFSARHLSVIHPLRCPVAERWYVSLSLIWTGPDWLISSGTRRSQMGRERGKGE